MTTFHYSIDEPIEDALLDPLSLHMQGWVFPCTPGATIVALDVLIGEKIVAETQLLFTRVDVNQAEGLPSPTRTGFTILGHLGDANPPEEVILKFRARLAGGSMSVFAERKVRLIPTDYRKLPYGVLLQEHATQFRRRDQIYGSGPSQNEPSPGILELLQRYLGPPPASVLDVGCGLATYGQQLLAAGYDWIGVEMKPEDCVELARRGLPHLHVDGESLPFADGSFANAMCMEVLEHIEDPHRFLAEIRRVSPRLLVSVPNVELLSYLAPYQAVPWHMLEGDHKNFFTRWGLRGLLQNHFSRAEVFSYSPCPLRSREGTRLDYHLFAVASS